MKITLQQELQQQRPFRSPQEEASLNLGRTCALMAEASEAFLRPYGVSPAQYNVLRILRGAGEAGLGRNQIRDRLVSRMPDVTRLLARLEDAGLLVRERSGRDRRYVPTRLTAAGRALVDRLDAPMEQHQSGQFVGLSTEQFQTLSVTLTQLRANLLSALEQAQAPESPPGSSPPEPPPPE